MRVGHTFHRTCHRLAKPSDCGCEAVAMEFLAEVSCTPQNAAQHVMALTTLTLIASAPGCTQHQTCLELAALIAVYRQIGHPFVIQSLTNDLPKVVHALYVVGHQTNIYFSYLKRETIPLHHKEYTFILLGTYKASNEAAYTTYFQY